MDIWSGREYNAPDRIELGYTRKGLESGRDGNDLCLNYSPMCTLVINNIHLCG